MNVKIDHLINHPERIKTVAGWIYSEFWSGKPGYSPEIFEVLLRNAKDRDRIPLSLIAFAGGAPAGTVNLVENDSDERPDLSPWLAALYVVPEFRGLGVGSALVRALHDEAARMNIDTLYLGTDIMPFYERLGAVIHDQVRADLWVMRLEIRSD